MAFLNCRETHVVEIAVVCFSYYGSAIVAVQGQFVLAGFCGLLHHPEKDGVPYFAEAH